MSESWQRLLAAIVARPAAIPGEDRQLRAALLAEPDLSADKVDGPLADGWRGAEPLVRQQILRDALEALPMGPRLCAALVACAVEQAHVSANAALHLLGQDATAPLTDTDWRRIARRARDQRDDLLPDIEAAQLLATRGPAGAFATVALLAFRDGPEDAEDRQLAIAALGRFDDPRVPRWLRAVAGSGALGIEAISAATDLAAQRLQSEDADIDELLAVLAAAAGAEPTHAIHVADSWVRWAAIDVATRLVGERALPLAAGAWLAGGADVEPWYSAAIEQRCRDVWPDGARDKKPRPSQADLVRWLADRGLQPAELAPIPPVAERVHARCPRIARRAMVVYEQSGPTADVLADAKATRAAVEQALVVRRQLMGSFLVEADTQPAALDAAWRPVCEALSPADRADLLAGERRWLDA